MFGATSRLLRRDDRDGRHQQPRDAAWYALEAVIDARMRISDVPRGREKMRGIGRHIRAGASLTTALDDLDRGFVAGLEDALGQQRPTAGVAVSSSDPSVSVRYELMPDPLDDRWRLRLALVPLEASDLASMTAAASRRAGALQHVLAAVNRVSSPEEAGRAALPVLLPVLDAECGAVYSVTGGETATVLAAFGPTSKRGFPYTSLELDAQPLAAMMQRPGVVSVLDGRRADIPPGLLDVCPRRVGLVALAPCFAGHSVTGVLVACRNDSAPLSIDEAGWLAAVADVMGLALGNSELTQESHLSEVVLETAVAVARAISGSLDLNETFTHIALSAARIMGDCRCLLLEADGDAGDLVAVAASDPADEILLGLRIRFDDAPDNRAALQERRSLIVDDVIWGARTQTAYREKLAMRSALFVPIHADQALIGSLLLFSAGRRESYSPGDIARAETVAEQAASAICNARLYRDLVRSQEQTTDLLERITDLRQRRSREIARAIHDDVLQTVVAALYELEGFREHVTTGSLDDVDRVAGLLRQTITEARRVIWDLRPPALESLGLRGAMAALVERVSREGGADITLEFADMPELDPGITTALYVIAREALQNASRHSSACHVVVSLHPEQDPDGAAPTRVVLRVIDDGCGFAVDAGRPADHFGLTMMDEQAALAGGRLLVTEGPGGVGTVVEAAIPVTQQEEGGPES
jgi:signal transduction histidine kinase